jgi:8-oxo-dGTP diphosphatase
VSIVLVRHARAGDRESWRGDDRLRPLDERGRVQALALAELLAPYPATRIVSSPFLRCLQTVEPLAAVRGLPIDARDELAEDRQELDGLDFLATLGGTDAIVCTHGGPPWSALAGGRYKKGGAILLDDEGRLLTSIAPP